MIFPVSQALHLYPWGCQYLTNQKFKGHWDKLFPWQQPTTAIFYSPLFTKQCITKTDMEIPTSGISYLYTGTIFLLGKYIPHANTIQEIREKFTCKVKILNVIHI